MAIVGVILTALAVLGLETALALHAATQLRHARSVAFALAATLAVGVVLLAS